MRAERLLAGGLAAVESDAGLEPLPVGIDQRDQRGRGAHGAGGKPCDSVEPLVARRVEDVQDAQVGQSLRLVGGQRRRLPPAAGAQDGGPDPRSRIVLAEGPDQPLGCQAAEVFASAASADDDERRRPAMRRGGPTLRPRYLGGVIGGDPGVDDDGGGAVCDRIQHGVAEARLLQQRQRLCRHSGADHRLGVAVQAAGYDLPGRQGQLDGTHR